MQSINEDKITTTILDLDAKNTGAIKEAGFLGMFGWAVESILSNMFSGGTIPVTIKGSPAQIGSFSRTLAGEKRYLEAWKNYGLDDPRTYRERAKLQDSINKFERLTGLDWPFE